MKIVHIATSTNGGAGIGLKRYHEALLRYGVDSRILVLSKNSSDGPEIEQITRPRENLIKRIINKFFLLCEKKRRMINTLSKANKSSNQQPNYELFSIPFSDFSPEEHVWIKSADIINLHWIAGFVDWPRFFGSVNKPIVLTLHDQQPYLGGVHYSLDLERNPHLIDLEKEILLIKKNALKGHEVAVISNSIWNTKEAKKSQFFPSNTLFETIYYPIDNQIFYPRPRRMAKETLGIDPSSKVIGFACDDLNNGRKGFSDLINALKALPSDNLVLLSFGRSPSRDLRDLVAIPWVHLGFITSETVQAAAYSAMDVFVIPSKAEAFGQTALEAIYCGVPVIGTNVGGIPEVLISSPHSKMYSPNNVEELSILLAEILKLDLPYCRDHLLNSVIQKHDAIHCAVAHIHVYNKIKNSFYESAKHKSDKRWT